MSEEENPAKPDDIEEDKQSYDDWIQVPPKARALVLKAKEKNQLSENWYPFQYLRTIIAGQASKAHQAREALQASIRAMMNQ